MKRKRYGWGWKNEERSCALNSVLQKLNQADRPHSVYSLVDYHACNSSVLSSKSRGKKNIHLARISCHRKVVCVSLSFKGKAQDYSVNLYLSPHSEQ
jgi:hypothetical protein